MAPVTIKYTQPINTHTPDPSAKSEPPGQHPCIKEKGHNPYVNKHHLVEYGKNNPTPHVDKPGTLPTEFAPCPSAAAPPMPDSSLVRYILSHPRTLV